MKYQYLILFLTALLLASCDNKTTIASGHPYIHHIKNNGYQPKQGDIIQYHFVQRNPGGVMYSTYEDVSPKIFRIPNVDPIKDEFNQITPLTEAMMLMSEGDSLTLELLQEFLPPQLDGVNDGESMYFDIKLVDVKSAEDIIKEETETKARGAEASAKMKKLIQKYNAGELKELQEIEGIQYQIEKKGTGKALKEGDVVLLHFSGHILETGKKYLDSYSQKRPYQVQIGAGRVIAAWETLLPTLHEGDKLFMFVPAAKAYGAAGSPGLGIPEKADLAIYLEVGE
jgi:FKBP-type peptidyl-prolyl cis-trans isomerase